MELSRPDFRLMTFCEYMKDLNQKKSFQNLKQHFDKNALIRTQAFFWFGLFRQVQFQWWALVPDSDCKGFLLERFQNV